MTNRIAQINYFARPDTGLRLERTGPRNELRLFWRNPAHTVAEGYPDEEELLAFADAIIAEFRPAGTKSNGTEDNDLKHWEPDIIARATAPASGKTWTAEQSPTGRRTLNAYHSSGDLGWTSILVDDDLYDFGRAIVDALGPQPDEEEPEGKSVGTVTITPVVDTSKLAEQVQQAIAGGLRDVADRITGA